MANQTNLKFEQILADIDKRKFTPLYLLEGDESYFIDEISKELENKVLKPEEKSFNQTIAYGKDITALEIKMACKRYPMMSEYQLIIIKEAQNLEEIEQLEDYLENPMNTTILVLCYKGKKVDKRKKVGKLFSKYTHFTADRLRDYEITPWIERFVKGKGRNIDVKAIQMIADFLGSDLGKIANEIEKMLVNVKKDVAIIGISHVEENIGISKEYNVFELQKALGHKNFNKAIQITHYFASNPKIYNSNYSKFILILFPKYTHHNLKGNRKRISQAIGVHEFFVDYKVAANNFHPNSIEQIFANLKYYDLRSKGVDDTNFR
ncbi:MAG: DNA polymerase III subunit delta [Bacteroidia bacterium]